MREALAEPLAIVFNAIKNTLERTPPELAADIAQRGILLAGGGVLLQGFAERVREETGMPAELADSPLTCVAVGSGLSLEEYDAMSRLEGAFQARPPARRGDRRIVLIRPTSALWRVFEVTGLDTLFPVFESLDDATSSLVVS